MLNTPTVVWGRDHEELAIKLYTDVSSNKNREIFPLLEKYEATFKPFIKHCTNIQVDLY